MSTSKSNISIQAMQKENKLLSENLQRSMDIVYGGRPYRRPSLSLSTVHDRVNKTLTVYAKFRAFRKGNHAWSYQVYKGMSLQRPVKKIFTSDENNMGYADIKVETINIDGAYQYPLKTYQYEVQCGTLEDDLILLVPDKSKPKIDG